MLISTNLGYGRPFEDHYERYFDEYYEELKKMDFELLHVDFGVDKDRLCITRTPSCID